MKEQAKKMKIILKSFDNFPRNRELSIGRKKNILKITSTKMEKTVNKYMGHNHGSKSGNSRF